LKRFSAALTVAILSVTLAACGSSSSTTSTSAAGATTSASRQQARLALAQCLRAHGLNVPDPGAGGATGGGGGGIFRSLQNVAPARLQAARQACASQFSAAFPRLNVSPAQQAQLRSQLVKFAECMRSHGVDVPDPQVGGGTGGFGFRRSFGSVDRNSPAFRTALTACQSLRPRFGGGGGGAGAPGGAPGA
jgi:hypothetical protein